MSLEFRPYPKLDGHISNWDVITPIGDIAGWIGWRQAWQKYIFISTGLALDERSMSEIADFLWRHTREQRSV